MGWVSCDIGVTDVGVTYVNSRFKGDSHLGSGDGMLYPADMRPINMVAFKATTTSNNASESINSTPL